MKNIFHKMNNKSKKAAKYFFIENRFGIWLLASLGLLNAVEGFIHLIVAAIGGWGAIDIQVWDLRIWLPIIENLVLGVFSLLTAWALDLKHHEQGENKE